MKKKNNLRVGIIGLGMVGEPIRRWFEEMKKYKRGEDLFCFDIDQKKGFQDDVNQADVIFVSVPTPTKKNGPSDISIVEKAVGTIADGKIIVLKSTIPPGTTEALQKKFPKKRFLFSPEFLTESQVWPDFIRPDRQILGPSSLTLADTKEVLALLPLAAFMRPWSTDYVKKEVSATEAEMAKYASNVFGYLKVVYGNVLADLSVGLSKFYAQRGIEARVNYENIREMMAADPRIGPAWLDVNHGNYSGAGGFCFPKDMNAFIAFISQTLLPALAKDKKVDPGLRESIKKGLGVLEAIRDYNRALLRWQGLKEEDLSRHSRDINLGKIKKIRR